MGNTDHEIDLAAIRERLLENQALVAQQSLETHDFPSLKNVIFLRELNIEVAILLALLDRPADFAAAFKERCAVREQRSDTVIPIRDHWNTLANQLYWDIATLLFRPASLKEMLAIMLPSLSQRLTISVADELPIVPRHPRALKEAERNLPAVLTLTSLETLSGPATLKELSEYTLTDTLALDVRDIARFPLDIHLTLFRALVRDYPALADQLYRHNASLKVLKDDIHTLIERGKTPRAALIQLMNALTISGTQMTGSDLASESITMEIESFQHFFEMIPDDIQKLLKSIRTNTISIGEILLNIDEGKCVEMASKNIRAILDAHPNEPLLNNLITALNFAPIYKRYTYTSRIKNQLETHRNAPVTFHFPHQLLVESIHNIVITSTEDLIVLLINFPTDYYELLWSNLGTILDDKLLNIATKIFTDQLLSSQQALALGRAIIKHFNRFNTTTNSIKWAIQTDHVDILTEAITYYSQSKLQKIIYEQSEDNYTLLHEVVRHAGLLRVILQSTPEEKRLQAIFIENIEGHTPFYLAAAYPESIKVILELFTKEDLRNGLINDENSLSIQLQNAAKRHESLALLLSLVPDTEHVNLISAPNVHGNTLLHLAATVSRSLHLLLDLLPADQRLDAVKKTNQNQESVLQLSASNPKCFQMLLDLYPQDEKLPAIKARSIKNSNALHVAVTNPAALRMVLDNYPENQRLEALTENPFLENKVICSIFRSGDDLRARLEPLPENQRLTALLTSDGREGDDCPMLFRFAEVEDMLGIILELLPPHQHAEVMKYKLPNGKTLLHVTTSLPRSFQQVMRFYSKAEITALLNDKIKGEAPLLFHAAHSPKLLQSLLEIYPEDQQSQIILSASHDGESLFHWTGYSEASLRLLLEKIPANKRLDVMTQSGVGMRPAFHKIMGHQSFLDFLATLTEQERFLVVAFKLNSGATVLHEIASYYPDSLWEILSLLSPSRRLDSLQLTDSSGMTLLHVNYLERTDLYQRLLGLYPENEKFSVINKPNKRNKSLLFHQIRNIAAVKTYLPFYQQNTLLEALDSKSKDNETLLKVAIDCPWSLKAILNYATQIMNPAGLKILNDMISLHLAQTAKESAGSFRELLAFLPEEQRMGAILQINESGESAQSAVMHNAASMQVLLELLPRQHREKAIQWTDYSNNNLLYCSAGDTRLFLSALELYKPQEQLRAINAINLKGETVLHAVAHNPELLNTILAIYPPSQRLPALKKLTRQNESVLFLTYRNFKSLRIALKLYPENQRMKALTQMTNAGDSVLTKMAISLDKFHKILKLLPKHHRLEAFEIFCQNSYGLKMPANINTLHQLLSLFFPHHRTRLFELISRDTFTLLHRAANKNIALKKVLGLYRKQDRLTALSIRDNTGNTVFHFATRQTSCLKVIYDLLPPEDIQTILRVAANDGNTPLHYAASQNYADSIDFILKKIPLKARAGMLMMGNHRQNTILHVVASQLKSLAIILSAIPTNRIFRAITRRNDQQQSVLHLAASNRECMQLILQYLTPSQRVEALELTDINGKKVLHCVANSHASFHFVYSQYPEDQKQAALRSITAQGETILSFARQQLPHVTRILKLIPKQERFDFIMTVDKQGWTVPQVMGAYSVSHLEAIIKHLPKDKRMAAVTFSTEAQASVLHQNCTYESTMTTIFAMLPTAHHVAALMARDKQGNTVLHTATLSPPSLMTLIDYLPPEKHQEALTAVNDQGETLLHRAASLASPGSLSILLPLYPVENRLAAMQVVDQQGYSALYHASRDENILFVAYQQIFSDEAEANRIVKSWLSEQVTSLLALLDDRERFSYPAFDDSSPALFKPAHPVATQTHVFIGKLAILYASILEENETSLKQTVNIQKTAHNQTLDFIHALRHCSHPRLADVIEQFAKDSATHIVSQAETICPPRIAF